MPTCKTNIELNIATPTADGFNTLYSNRFGAHYHSVNGAYTECTHIFINHGLNYATAAGAHINILEVGFGTGLNAALTATQAESTGTTVHYTSLDLYPIATDKLQLLNYPQALCPSAAERWQKIVNCQWNKRCVISDSFSIEKIQADFTLWSTSNRFNLIYFDAFAPNNQPEMWTDQQFIKLHGCLCNGGVLVTYSSKGTVKQALRNAGFKVERLPGPPGKRHIVRAVKEEGM